MPAPDLSRLQPGSTWSQWTLVRQIRPGGFAQVWLARSGDGRRAAIKFLTSTSTEARRRFKREERLSRESHGRWVPVVLDAFHDGSIPWIAFEYLDLPALDEVVSRRGPLAGDSLVTFAWNLWDAVREFHAQHIAHRDLSPRNVLVDVPRRSLRVIDLGSGTTRDATSITRAGFPVSMGYAAPEQFDQDGSAQPVDEAADIWGWATVVYYAATGEPILPAASYQEELRSYRRANRAFNLAAVPPSLRRALDAALRYDPADRRLDHVTAAMPPRVDPSAASRGAGRLRPAVVMAAVLAIALVTNACTYLVSRSRFGLLPGGDRRVLVIGVNGDYPGWSKYENGEWRGFDVRLGHWVADDLDREPLFVPVPTDERIEALQTGRVDLVIANFSITDDRRRQIDFAGPYFKDVRAFMRWPDRAEGEVCVPKGSTSDIGPGRRDSRLAFAECIQQFFDSRANTPLAAVETDLAVLEPFVFESKAFIRRVQRYVWTDQERARLDEHLRQVEPIVPQPDPGQPEHYGVGLPDGSGELCERISDALARFIDENDGGWDDVFTETLGPFAMSVGARKPTTGELQRCG